MATNVTLNGNVYSIPAVGEDNWGQTLTDYFIAIPSGVLQKTGGTFTITADVNFGATYGLLAKYFASRSGAATDGLVRLSNLDAINWRNFANTADIGLALNSSDVLTFGGQPLLVNSITSLTGDVVASGPGAAASTIQANVVDNSKLAQVASGVFKARATAGTGDVEDLSATQATAVLDVMVGDSGSGGTKGLVPAPAAGDAAALKFLKADGTWATPAGGTLFNVIDGTNGSVIEGNVGANVGGGVYAHAEGHTTTATGVAAHAQGQNTTASGSRSSAMGESTLASGQVSMAMGTGTIAQAFNQVAIGQYNVGAGNANTYVSTDKAFVIGRGASSGARENAFAVTKEGQVQLFGTSSGQLGIKPAAATSSYDIVMPDVQGAASSVLTNDGSGNLSWGAGGGSAIAWYGSVTGNTALSSATLADFPGTGVITQDLNQGIGTVTAASVSNGVTFTPPSLGIYKVYTTGYVAVSAGNASPGIRLANGSSTPLSQLLSVTQATAGGGSTIASFVIFNVLSLSPVTIKIMGTINAGTSTLGPMQWSIEQIAAASPLPPVSIATPVAVFNETQPSGTNGGTFTSGAWRTRVLNTIQTSQSWASLGSNQITLAAGSYYVEASAPGVQVDFHKIKLRNITDSTDDLIGSSECSNSLLNPMSTSSIMRGVITIAASKVYEIQHRCFTTASTIGLGDSSSLGVSEIYTQVSITKVG